jgi:arylsulfatase A-like enzyme
MVRNDMVNYGHRFTQDEYAVSPEMTLGLDPRELTLGDLLRPGGYACGVVGKWDMGQAKRYLPLQRGFDYFYGHGNNGIDYYTHERYGIPSMFEDNQRTQADRGRLRDRSLRRKRCRVHRTARRQTPVLFIDGLQRAAQRIDAGR